MLEVAKSPESQDNFQHVVGLLDDAKKFFYRIGDVEIEKKVSEMAAQINEPLYLVVAGETVRKKNSQGRPNAFNKQNYATDLR